MKTSKDKIRVATHFFEAFSNKNAREFLHKTMIAHYTEAILYHHPRKEKFNRTDIFQKSTKLVDHIFAALSEISNKPELLHERLLKLSRKFEPRSSVWFLEFNEAYNHYKTSGKLPLIGDVLLPHLQKAASIVDFGCGDGEMAVFIRNKLGLSTITGIDILDWRSERNKQDKNFLFYRRDFSKQGNALDISGHHSGIMHAMLHHVSNNKDEIASYLKKAEKIVTEKLLIVEDVLYSPLDRKLSVPGIETIQKRTKEQSYFAEFLKLSIQEQRSVIAALDLLSNSLAIGIPDMNFPFGAQTLSDWIEIFSKSGLTIQEVNVLGFQEHLFHRMSQVLFVTVVN